MAKFPIALDYSGDNCYVTMDALIVISQSSYSLLIWRLGHLRCLVKYPFKLRMYMSMSHRAPHPTPPTPTTAPGVRWLWKPLCDVSQCLSVGCWQAKGCHRSAMAGAVPCHGVTLPSGPADVRQEDNLSWPLTPPLLPLGWGCCRGRRGGVASALHKAHKTGLDH